MFRLVAIMCVKVIQPKRGLLCYQGIEQRLRRGQRTLPSRLVGCRGDRRFPLDCSVKEDSGCGREPGRLHEWFGVTGEEVRSLDDMMTRFNVSRRGV
jgi:hypothetical protein